MKKSVLFMKKKLVAASFIALSASNAIAGGGTQGPDVSGDAIRPISPSTFVRSEQYFKIEEDCMNQILETHLSTLPAGFGIKKVQVDDSAGRKIGGYQANNRYCAWAIDSDQSEQITISGRVLKMKEKCATATYLPGYENEVIYYTLSTNEDAPKIEFKKTEVPSYDSLSGEIISKTYYYSDIKISLRSENMTFKNTNTNRVIFSYPSAKYAACLKSGLSVLQSRK